MTSPTPGPGPAAPSAQTEPPRLRTGSVRARATVGVILALALVLAGTSVAVSAVFRAQSERSLATLLDGRAQLARQLARTGVGPQQLVTRVSADGVQAELVLRNGTVFGTPVGSGPQIRTAQTRLSSAGRVDGATLTLAVDTSLLTGAEDTLRRVLLVSALLALLVAAAAVAVIIRLSLAPLAGVAALAADIRAGHRGGRLRPDRTDTEIGQTAYALDEMLDELEGAESRARQAEERTRTFLADAAHELRTPLAGIRAAAETMLHSAGDLTTEQREQLEVLLVREAGRAGSLVDDLLATARLDAGAPVTAGRVSLTALARAEVEHARLVAPQTTVDLEVTDLDIAGDLVVLGVADQLAGILRNLVANALRAAGPAGRVRIAVGLDHDDPGRPRAVVEVTDSGPGVPAADRERIFDRLVRLDTAREAEAGGSGLGLAIARGWARSHGGDVVCLPPLDRPALTGARFRLTLPLPGPMPRPDGFSAPAPTGR